MEQDIEVSIIIRDAVIQDADAITHLEQITFPMPWSRESIAHDIENNTLATVLVAEVDGEFAGYADIWIIAGEGQLNNIAVMPEMKGRHVGMSIMEELIRRLEQADAFEMSLEVRDGNVPAISLYERLGFTTTGTRPGYYLDNGDDALIMKLEIKA